MKNAYYLILLALLFGCKDAAVLYSNALNTSENWIIEQQPSGQAVFSNKKLEVIDANGCTIWFKNPLEAPVKISYDITIINDGGTYDRVSDMNCLWMANDPKNTNDFFKASKVRAGHFPNFHHLTGYYVGYGGHHNTKTRFRRYNGNIDLPLLPEHDLSDKQFLITANKNAY